jgi:hypothetical protein
MQIIPSNGGWTNAAASVQNTHHDAKGASKTGQSTSSNAPIRLEHSEKTGDRDANERYFGASTGQENSGEGNLKDQAAQENDLLSLPALEDTPQSLLDLMG